METVKIYNNDPYINKTVSHVLAVNKENDHSRIVLDQTIFYPGGGGQRHDKGTLNGIPVENIIIDNDTIWHEIASDLNLSGGEEVTAEINWPYRYYNMQQHSGQHLLSFVLYKHDFQTVSVHLGEEYTLIEVDHGFPDNELLEKIEEECNQLINKAVPIKSYWIKQDELSKYPLRRSAGNYKNIRIVEIENLDYTACGGTHVKNTSEIGLIKIAGVEKIRNHARIKVAIGSKAYEYFNQLHKTIDELKKELPSDLQSLSIKVRQLKEKMQSLKKEKGIYQNLYIKQLCKTFTETEQNIVFYKFQNLTGEDLQLIARCIKKQDKINAFFLSENRFCFVSTEKNKEVTQLFLSKYRDVFLIKAGGLSGFIQGTIDKFDEENLLSALNELSKIFYV